MFFQTTPTLKVAGSNPVGRTFMKPCNLNGCRVFVVMKLEVVLGLFHFSRRFVRKNVRKQRKKHAANPVKSMLCGLFTVSGFMSGIA